MTDLQEYLCELAESNYEDKIEKIMELDIIRIEGDWIVVKDKTYGEANILLENLI